MASTPDVRRYVDLTLFDRHPTDILAVAVELLQQRIPEWVPSEADQEVLLLEAASEVVAELVFAVNRVPGAVMRALLGLYGLTPDAGVPPQATVRIDVSDDFGRSIPGGTAMLLVLGPDEQTFELHTVESLDIPPGSTSGVVAVVGTEPTTAANGTPAGVELEMLDAIAYVERAVLDTTVGGGVDPESGDAFLDRGQQRLQRLTETLVLPAHFEARALEDPRVGRAKAVDIYDPNQTGDPGDHPGHVTVVLASPEGEPVSAEVHDELRDALAAASLAVLQVHTADPDITDVNVTVTLTRLPGHDSADVAAAVEQAVRDYLDPASWQWDGTVRRYELISLIDRVPGVDYVENLAAPAADVQLSGHGPLARADEVVVNVNLP